MLEGADDDFDIEELLDEFSDLSVGAARKKVREIQFMMGVNAHKVFTLSTLWAYPADNILIFFSYFSQNLRFDISCKLSHRSYLNEISNPFLQEKNLHRDCSLTFITSYL